MYLGGEAGVVTALYLCLFQSETALHLENAKHSLNDACAKLSISYIHNASGLPLSTAPVEASEDVWM